MGKYILIPGAGSAGANWTVRIANYTSTTEVRTSGATATTTVSGVSATVGDTLTEDGTHPNITGHCAMAAAVTVV